MTVLETKNKSEVGLKRKLYIGNVDAESQIGEPEKLTWLMRRVTADTSNRLIWMMDNHDIVLLPFSPSHEFIHYAMNLMGKDPNTISVIVPEGGDEDSQILTYNTVNSKEIKDKINAVVDTEDSLEIVPYFFDRAISVLSQSLPYTQNTDLVEYLRQGGAETLNSKVEFRRIAAANDIPVPEGTNCFTDKELIEAVKKHITDTGSVIVKQDLNAGGDGNFVITQTDQESFIGSSGTYHVNSEKDIEVAAQSLWNELTGSRNHTLVVEAYHKSVSVFYSEVEVYPDRLRPYVLNFGDMRMAPKWNGFEIPTRSLDEYSLAEFISGSTQLAKVAKDKGYVGKINIDGILTDQGDVLFSEINGRIGGCSHIHYIGEKLYGRNYGSSYFFLTKNKVKVPGDFASLLNTLLDEELLVRNKHETGVVILTEDMRMNNTIEYLVVGNTYDDALSIETQLEQVINRMGAVT